MSRVLRNYQHVDYTSLLYELNRKAKNEQAVIEIQASRKMQGNKQNEIPLAKRDSLMGNLRMRYVYSVQKAVLRDRECSHVAEIEDENFQMLEDFPNNMRCCQRCYRRVLIRAGLQQNDTKWVYSYLYVLDLFGATNRDIYRLVIENGAQLCEVGNQMIYLKVRDDCWQICKEESGLCLYHNNYEVTEEYERIFNHGFHLQQKGTGEKDFFAFTTIACNYSWPAHVKRLKAQALELRKQQCRVQLARVNNFVRMKRFSLLYEYYTVLDCNGKAPRFLARNYVSAKEFSRCNDQEGLYRFRNYRVLRFHHRRFLGAMEALKEYSILREYWDYAEKCSELLPED